MASELILLDAITRTQVSFERLDNWGLKSNDWEEQVPGLTNLNPDLYNRFGKLIMIDGKDRPEGTKVQFVPISGWIIIEDTEEDQAPPHQATDRPMRFEVYPEFDYRHVIDRPDYFGDFMVQGYPEFILIESPIDQLTGER